GFTSAIILAMIALLIGYEAISRLFAPVPIHFAEAIPVAVLGLAVNVASVWLLGGGDHHGHSHGHGHSHHGHDEDDTHLIAPADGDVILEVVEDGVPSRFRLRAESSTGLLAATASIETVRADGARQLFALEDRGDYLESTDEIPEPHAFGANVRIGKQTYPVQ